MKIVSAQQQSRCFNVQWQDGNASELPFIWLRDNDPSDLHPKTFERTFDLTSVDIDIAPDSYDVNHEALIIRWPGNRAPSVYSSLWLFDHRPGAVRDDAARITRKSWSASDLNTLPRADAQACHTSEQSLHDALVVLKTYGIIILENLETTAEAGETFGDLIGFKRQTNFGVNFDVINMPNPNNLAYTALSLPQHTDLSNQEQVPGLQFLQCIKNTAKGGLSTFTDALRVVEDFADELPEAYQILCDVQVPWRFHDKESDIRYRRPVINFDNQGEFQLLALNPHIADVPDMPAELLYDFYKAYQEIMQRTRSDKYMLGYALQAGEMAIFDNQRLLHGRTQFDPNSGERHLHGYYIEHNELNSKIRLLNSRITTKRI